MLKTLEKYWPIISILFIAALLACLLFWPSASRLFGLVVLVLSVTMGIAFTIRKHILAWRKGQIDRSTMIRNSTVDVLGMLITIIAAILIAGRVAQSVGLFAGGAAESQWPGSGMIAGILSGMAAGLLIGLLIGRFVQTTWGRLAKRPQAVPAKDTI
jgi:hypothetical protein